MSNSANKHSMTQLFEKIGEAFPDNYVNKVLDQGNLDLEPMNLSESLAAYIVKEVRELYDKRSSKEANAERVRASLARSAHILGTVSELLGGRRPDLLQAHREANQSAPEK